MRLHGARIHHNSYRVLRYLYGEVFSAETYDVGELGNSSVIVDCGANIGVATWFFQHRYPGSRVIAIEPAPLSFDLLSRNVGANGWNVEIHNEASLGQDGEVRLYTKRSQSATPAASVLVERGTDQDMTVVPARRLSSRLPDQVDLLKLDVEGAEHEVMQELEESDSLRKIDRVAIEYHHHVRSGEDLPGFLQRLHRNGFTYSIVAAGDRTSPDAYQDLMIYGARR